MSLFNHDFRLKRHQYRFDRIGIKYIGDGRFYALFHQSLSFFLEHGLAQREARPLGAISRSTGRPIAPVPPAKISSFVNLLLKYETILHTFVANCTPPSSLACLPATNASPARTLPCLARRSLSRHAVASREGWSANAGRQSLPGPPNISQDNAVLQDGICTKIQPQTQAIFHLCTRRNAFYRHARQPTEPEKTFLCMDLS